MTFKIIFSECLHFRQWIEDSEFRRSWSKVTWVIRGRGTPGSQVTRGSRSLRCPFQYFVFEMPNKALLLTRGKMFQRVASFPALLSANTHQHHVREIFLLPLNRVIYKVGVITLGFPMCVLSASLREASPLPGPLQKQL